MKFIKEMGLPLMLIVAIFVGTVAAFAMSEWLHPSYKEEKVAP